MEHYLSVVRECMETGVRPRCHLEDITRSDIYGFVIPFCLELMKLMDEYGIPVKIRVCDTMGYGVNYPGAVIPRSIPGIIYGLMVHAGVPSELIEFHGTMISTRRSITLRRHGCTARQGSTARCLASASGPAIRRWRPWSSNTRSCAGHLTAWIRP